MIPAIYLAQWRAYAPWSFDTQVEQDLILTKVIIQIFSDPILAEALAFRGGTAIQKLFYEIPTRYSEDIDLVQIKKGPIGGWMDAIRKHLDPWLGEPRRNRKESRATLIYHFNSELSPIQRMRLKIEVNTGENFTVLGAHKKTIQAKSNWFNGHANVTTYELEELLGTKMRALFQRKKGRDLYDLSMALEHFPKLDFKKIIQCFQSYMDHGNTLVTRAQFEANFSEKLLDPSFIADIQPLLAPNAPPFNVKAAGERVKTKLLALLPGDPWKGHGEVKKTIRRK